MDNQLNKLNDSTWQEILFQLLHKIFFNFLFNFTFTFE